MAYISLIKEIAINGANAVIDSDINASGKVCTLIQDSKYFKVAKLDVNAHPIPIKWKPHVEKIRWIGHNQVAIWPIAPLSSGPPFVGTLDGFHSATIGSAFPLDLFADRSCVIFVFSEEFTRIDVPKDQRSDLILAINLGYNKVNRKFADLLSESYSDESFLEVTCGVTDAESEAFWFAAYNTSLLWRFSFRDGGCIKVGELGVAPYEVIAICCQRQTATVICKRREKLEARQYLATEKRIELKSVSEILAEEDVNEILNLLLNNSANRIVGMHGNRCGILMPDRAIIIGLN